MGGHLHAIYFNEAQEKRILGLASLNDCRFNDVIKYLIKCGLENMKGGEKIAKT